MTAEHDRLNEDREKKQHWRKWGPYLSERQWGTVREDFSKNGDAWDSFTFEQSKSRAYRWGEDGIAGISDNHQRLCFAWTFWNEKDPILKERLFGLSGKEGNHGEDVKEYYFHSDNTPTHSYMRYLYKYPQDAFPYQKLIDENKKRSSHELEYELLDTGVFEHNRYFDVYIEYAKEGPEDLCFRLTACNRGPELKPLHILPTVWFRNTWSWGGLVKKPLLKLENNILVAEVPEMGRYYLYADSPLDYLFTENETGLKDAFHRYLIGNHKNAIHENFFGTKAAAHFRLELKPGESRTLYFRLCPDKNLSDPLKSACQIIDKRKQEADEFYNKICDPSMSEDLKHIQRQAFSGLLWNKQFYHYVVEQWLKIPRQFPRNKDWVHVYTDDVLSVPDKWEYPCFFSWDTAFHALPLAIIDPEFAKRQLTLLTREWYMHPNGQIPAYEWSFSDVNPPVHAWAAWRVFKIEQKATGREDRVFLETIFQKLLLNFTWWVNRKDSEDKNIFQGGFLGLDNISVFNRSELPTGGKLYQSDATSWMAMYSINMLTIALELAQKNPSYEDMASKFFEHFLYIASAMNYPANAEISLWNEEDGFYYDVLVLPSGQKIPIKVRSIAGLIPLFCIGTTSHDHLNQFQGFSKRREWFINNRPDLCESIASLQRPGESGRSLISILPPERLKRVLSKMLDENEFLSPYGIRSLSKYHEKHPYTLKIENHEYHVAYEPAETTVKLYGGNSNWRGPIWFPLNMLIIESLQKYHYYYGDEFKVECPKGSGKMLNLWEVAAEISHRLIRIFEKDEKGRRPVFGGSDIFNQNPEWKECMLFYEYFHGDNGAGIGASHQTGWTGLIAKLIQQLGHFSH